VAYVVPSEERYKHELRGFTKQKLPEHMIPIFCIHDSLPLTPDQGRPTRSSGSRQSRPELEQALSIARTTVELIGGVWKVLGIKDRCHDNFFDLGDTR
jgi:hypothetical protein